MAAPPASSCCCLLASVACYNDRNDLPRSMYDPNGCTDGLVGVNFAYQESVRFMTRKMGRSYSCYDRLCTLCLGATQPKSCTIVRAGPKVAEPTDWKRFVNSILSSAGGHLACALACESQYHSRRGSWAVILMATTGAPRIFWAS